MKIFAAKGTSSRIATTKVCSTLHLGNMPAAWHKDDTAGQQLTTKRLRPIQFHVARRQAQRTIVSAYKIGLGKAVVRTK